jgi:hypothetical protein
VTFAVVATVMTWGVVDPDEELELLFDVQEIATIASTTPMTGNSNDVRFTCTDPPLSPKRLSARMSVF